MTLTAERTARRTPEEKRLDKIRNRRSYQMFRELADYLHDKPSLEGTLRFVNGLLNEKSAYGSMTAAGYAQESMELVIEDINRG